MTPSQQDAASLDSALADFVQALRDLDRERLAACFATGATVFLPWGGTRRAEIWNERFDALRDGRPGPPYQDILPEDVEVQWLGEVAVATFHLRRGERLGRRTVVLTHGAGGWKIVHLHASNLPA
jgi:ketosteroid isomerase-like protein